jgi:hypothetical protein
MENAGAVKFVVGMEAALVTALNIELVVGLYIYWACIELERLEGRLVG